MNTVTIENTNKYRVDSIGNGLAYAFYDKTNGAQGFLQGDDATAWREKYSEIEKSHRTRGTRHFRLTWNECLYELIGAHLGD